MLGRTAVNVLSARLYADASIQFVVITKCLTPLIVTVGKTVSRVIVYLFNV